MYHKFSSSTLINFVWCKEVNCTWTLYGWAQCISTANFAILPYNCTWTLYSWAQCTAILPNNCTWTLYSWAQCTAILSYNCTWTLYSWAQCTAILFCSASSQLKVKHFFNILRWKYKSYPYFKDAVWIWYEDGNFEMITVFLSCQFTKKKLLKMGKTQVCPFFSFKMFKTPILNTPWMSSELFESTDFPEK